MPGGDRKSDAKKTVVVTTSWDDGDRFDLKLAELLASRGLRGTFYVPSGNMGTASVLAPSRWRELADAGFEVGAHTVTHPILTDIASDSLVREIAECKQVLEQMLGREVPSFAYPKGRTNSAIAMRLKRAGYRSARGLRMLSLSLEFPPFDMPVTVQAYPHRWMGYARNLLRRGAVATLAKSSIQIGRSKNWVQLGKTLFDRALRDGGAWHLVGHSWETEKIGGWDDLAEMLDYVAGREGIRYLTNGQLAQFAHLGDAAAVADVAMGSNLRERGA
jgi:peptidoglycan/xylan/chitin deacetylase (PgdA/CDA1 family)